MLTRHLNELMARLERVSDIGVAEIRKKELVLWYNRDRITRGVWADLYEKWQEVDDVPLLIGEADGVWTLAFGDGLQTSESSWFKDVRERAGIVMSTATHTVSAGEVGEDA